MILPAGLINDKNDLELESVASAWAGLEHVWLIDGELESRDVGTPAYAIVHSRLQCAQSPTISGGFGVVCSPRWR